MPDGRKFARFHASRFTSRVLHFPTPHGVHAFRYRHVLVSTSLSVADRAALVLGFELAALHQATLTLLQVLPPPPPDRSAHGLEAIGLLHAATEELLEPPAARMPSRAARPKLRKFVEDHVPQGLLDTVIWRGECRAGTASETIVSYANESAADLVILSAKPFWRWLPLVSFAVWTIERRTRANVIVVRDRAPSQLS